MPPAPHLRQTRAPFINLLSHLDFITPRCAYIVRSIAAAGLALAVAYGRAAVALHGTTIPDPTLVHPEQVSVRQVVPV